MSFPYPTTDQFDGAAFLAGRPVAMLADRVGYGKTAQLVIACDIVGAQKILVVCPPNLRRNEAYEFDKWSAYSRPATILTSGRDPLPPIGLAVVSYQLAARPEVAGRLRDWRPDVVAFDEAHALKNPGGVTSRACLGATGIARGARYVWFLSGTPTPNNAGEFYVFAAFCGAFKKGYLSWQGKFCVTIPQFFHGKRSTKIVGSRNVDELKTLLSPYVLMRDGIEEGRAPITIDEFACDAEPPQYPLPPSEIDAITAAIEAGDLDGLDYDSVSTIRRLIGMAKADSVATLVISEHRDAPTQRTIVFASHTGVIDTIQSQLADARLQVGVLDGRTKDRDKVVLLADLGSSAPQTDVLICHQRSASEGHTLTGANRIILAEPDWTPAYNTQMIARAWRRGQSKHVRATFCFLPGSIDTAISKVLLRKMKDVETLKI